MARQATHALPLPGRRSCPGLLQAVAAAVSVMASAEPQISPLEFTSGIGLVRAIQKEEETTVLSAVDAGKSGFRVDGGIDYPELSVLAEEGEAVLTAKIPAEGEFFAGLVMMGRAQRIELLAGERLIGAAVNAGETRRLRIYFSPASRRWRQDEDLRLRVLKPEPVVRVECFLLLRHRPPLPASSGMEHPPPLRRAHGQAEPTRAIPDLQRFRCFLAGGDVPMPGPEHPPAARAVEAPEALMAEVEGRDGVMPAPMAAALQAACSRYRQSGDEAFQALAGRLADQVLDAQDAAGGWPHRLWNGGCPHDPPHRGNTAEEMAELLAAVGLYGELFEDERAGRALASAAGHFARHYILPDGRLRRSSCPESGPADSPIRADGLLRGWEAAGIPRLGEAAFQALQTALRMPENQVARGPAGVLGLADRVFAGAWGVAGPAPVEFHLLDTNRPVRTLRLDGVPGSVFVLLDSKEMEIERVRVPEAGACFLEFQGEKAKPVRVRALTGRRWGVWSESGAATLDISRGVLLAGERPQAYAFRLPERGGLLQWEAEGKIPAPHRLAILDSEGRQVVRTTWNPEASDGNVPVRLLVGPAQGGQVWTLQVEAPGEVFLKAAGIPPEISVFPGGLKDARDARSE
ncbi:MAG: hypothetical protein HYU36_03750 [Planctomycetes bacterium]|nr:hypothetical protein [Planctomycetota bacterium]